jgi:hypothetical protein
MGDDEPVQVYLTESYMQAQFLRNMLSDVGILATVIGNDGYEAGGVGMASRPVLWTRRSDALKARQIVEEWERGRVNRAAHQGIADLLPLPLIVVVTVITAFLSVIFEFSWPVNVAIAVTSLLFFVSRWMSVRNVCQRPKKAEH